MTPCRSNIYRVLLSSPTAVAALGVLALFAMLTGCRNASQSSTADAGRTDQAVDAEEAERPEGTSAHVTSQGVSGSDAPKPENRSGAETGAVERDAAPTAEGGGEKDPSFGLRGPGETEVIASDSGLTRDEMLALAAGPMADSVNSSLVRLDTNLGKKEHTLVLMALRSETLRWYFLTHMTDIIDESQLLQATELIDSYEPRFQDLLNRRASILETIREGDQVAELLDINKVACIKLAMQLRQQVLRTVLTAEQRAAYAAKFEKKKNPSTDNQKPGD